MVLHICLLWWLNRFKKHLLWYFASVVTMSPSLNFPSNLRSSRSSAIAFTWLLVGIDKHLCSSCWGSDSYKRNNFPKCFLVRYSVLSFSCWDPRFQCFVFRSFFIHTPAFFYYTCQCMIYEILPSYPLKAWKALLVMIMRLIVFWEQLVRHPFLEIRTNF